MFHIRFKIVLVSKYIDSVDCFFVCFVVVVVFWLQLWRVEVPGPGIKPVPQLQPHRGCCGDNARYLTHCATRERPLSHF